MNILEYVFSVVRLNLYYELLIYVLIWLSIISQTRDMLTAKQTRNIKLFCTLLLSFTLTRIVNYKFVMHTLHRRVDGICIDDFIDSVSIWQYK